jgi:hypothetical protein
MIVTARHRVSFSMNRFSTFDLIGHNRSIEVHLLLPNGVLPDRLVRKNSRKKQVAANL